MLIIVIGRKGSGKSYFTQNRLFPYIGDRKVTQYTDVLPVQLQQLEWDDEEIVVIEVATDKDVPHKMRSRISLIVFTEDVALGDYFNRDSNDVADVAATRAYSAMKSICGSDFAPVVFDPHGKRFMVHYS